MSDTVITEDIQELQGTHKECVCAPTALLLVSSSCTSQSVQSLTIGMSSDTAGGYTCTALMAELNTSKHCEG